MQLADLCSALIQEEVVPGLVLPDGLKPRGLDVQPAETAFDPPLAPSYPLQPPPPPYEKPVYGADWTGLKPFQVTSHLRFSRNEHQQIRHVKTAAGNQECHERQVCQCSSTPGCQQASHA